MSIRKSIAAAFILGSLLLPSSVSAQFNWPYKVTNGKAVTEVPVRTAGQESALNMTTPKLKVVRVAFVGLGMRGHDACRALDTHPRHPSNWLSAIMSVTELRDVKNICVKQVCLQPIFTLAKMATRSFASVRILTLCILLQTGSTTFLVAYEAMNKWVKHVAVESTCCHEPY